MVSTRSTTEREDEIGEVEVDPSVGFRVPEDVDALRDGPADAAASLLNRPKRMLEMVLR